MFNYGSTNNEITSGEIGGFKLDKKKYNIPKNDNISGIINGNLNKLQIANKFMKLGWSVRKSSFTDYEVKGKWTEFSIEGENEILLNGIIDINKIGELKKLLDNLNVIYSLEIY